MKHKFMVDEIKFGEALAVCLFLFVMAGTMIYLGRIESMVMFGLLGLLFAYVASIHASCIELDETKIRKTLCGLRMYETDWSQIKEVGVCGTNPAADKRPDKSGRLYIYLSAKKLTDAERRTMILKWPPKTHDQLYFVYTPERFDSLRTLWSGEVEEYNLGNKRIS